MRREFPNSLLERQLTQRAQLLRWRARRAADPPYDTSTPAPVEMAIALLADGIDGESRDFGAWREALRVLALAGYWDEVDAALSRYPLQTECFESALLLGDLALIRARMGLGLPAVDDDYDEPTADTLALLSALSAGALRQAEDHYRAALQLAEAEDARLETNWYGNGLRSKFNMLSCIAWHLP